MCVCVCFTDIDECKGMPCLNNGSCVQGAGSFTCLCEAGYTGVLCETGELGVFWFFSAHGGKVGISLQRKYFLLLSPSTLSCWQLVWNKEFLVYVEK